MLYIAFLDTMLDISLMVRVEGFFLIKWILTLARIYKSRDPSGGNFSRFLAFGIPPEQFFKVSCFRYPSRGNFSRFLGFGIPPGAIFQGFLVSESLQGHFFKVSWFLRSPGWVAVWVPRVGRRVGRLALSPCLSQVRGGAVARDPPGTDR